MTKNKLERIIKKALLEYNLSEDEDLLKFSGIDDPEEYEKSGQRAMEINQDRVVSLISRFLTSKLSKAGHPSKVLAHVELEVEEPLMDFFKELGENTQELLASVGPKSAAELEEVYGAPIPMPNPGPSPEYGAPKPHMMDREQIKMVKADIGPKILDIFRGHSISKSNAYEILQSLANDMESQLGDFDYVYNEKKVNENKKVKLKVKKAERSKK